MKLTKELAKIDNLLRTINNYGDKILQKVGAESVDYMHYKHVISSIISDDMLINNKTSGRLTISRGRKALETISSNITIYDMLYQYWRNPERLDVMTIVSDYHNKYKSITGDTPTASDIRDIAKSIYKMSIKKDDIVYSDMELAYKTKSINNSEFYGLFESLIGKKPKPQQNAIYDRLANIINNDTSIAQTIGYKTPEQREEELRYIVGDYFDKI